MTAFLTSLSSVGEIVLVIALGFWLRNSGRLGDTFKNNISFIIMDITLPVSIFIHNWREYPHFDKWGMNRLLKAR